MSDGGRRGTGGCPFRDRCGPGPGERVREGPGSGGRGGDPAEAARSPNRRLWGSRLFPRGEGEGDPPDGDVGTAPGMTDTAPRPRPSRPPPVETIGMRRTRTPRPPGPSSRVSSESGAGTGQGRSPAMTPPWASDPPGPRATMAWLMDAGRSRQASAPRSSSRRVPRGPCRRPVGWGPRRT